MHIVKTSPGLPATDGAGVQLTRMIGTPQLDMVDPFLMLDRFDADDPGAYIAGFPEHPHRGFETVTIMLEGQLRHRDSTGGEGVIGAGDVQWMTAGRGIIHSEMPEIVGPRMRGFQLWVNLPAAHKMATPGYQDIGRDSIPELELPGVKLRLIAGSYAGKIGPAVTRTPIGLFLAFLEPGARFTVSLPQGHNGFIGIHEGSITAPVGAGLEREIKAPTLALLGGGSGDMEIVAGAAGASLFIAHGEPLREPVARYGPFVMNTREELVQAVEDFQAGRFGT